MSLPYSREDIDQWGLDTKVCNVRRQWLRTPSGQLFEQQEIHGYWPERVVGIADIIKEKQKK